MKFVLLAVMFCAMNVQAQNAGKELRIGFVSLTTVQAATTSDQAGSFAGGVVVRFYEKSTHLESFSVTDSTGMSIAPLREGAYCAEAYGTDGTLLKLNSQTESEWHRCFILKAGQTIEFSMTLAHDVKYTRKIPAIAIN